MTTLCHYEESTQFKQCISHSEFGEIDPDKVKAAVNRFTHSCAGYSVATYVLVGDSKHMLLQIDFHAAQFPIGHWRPSQ